MHEIPLPIAYAELKAYIDRNKKNYERKDHGWFNGGTYTMLDGSVYLVIALVPANTLRERVYKDSSSSGTQFSESQWHNAFKEKIAELGGVFGVDSGVTTGIIKASDGQTIDWLYTQMQSALVHLTIT